MLHQLLPHWSEPCIPFNVLIFINQIAKLLAVTWIACSIFYAEGHLFTEPQNVRVGKAP